MKTYEQLKALKAEDFLAPNPVLCYGGGGAFESIAPIMLKCGINIVGVIDANKKGFAELNEKKIPFLSIEQAKQQYGSQVNIFIMIANVNIINEVEKNLIEAGFEEKHIFDMNAWQWLTIPSEKSYCCDMTQYFGLLDNSFILCCQPKAIDRYQVQYFIEGISVEESSKHYQKLREHYSDSAKCSRVPLYCKDCPVLEVYSNQELDKIHTVIFSDNSVCNCDCAYCDYRCSVKRKRIGNTLEDRLQGFVCGIDSLKNKDLLKDNVSFVIAGGEITIYPNKKIIYDLIKDIPQANIEILTNGFIYDSTIAEILESNNKSILRCDLDSGTEETYIKVKGFNKLRKVIDNLKEYSKYGKIQLKHIILVNWNDTDADYKGIVDILHELNLNQLILSPELGRYAKIRKDRMKIREIIYSTAKLVSVLYENNIDVIFFPIEWCADDITLIKRFAKEIQSLKSNNI